MTKITIYLDFIKKKLFFIISISRLPLINYVLFYFKCIFITVPFTPINNTRQGANNFRGHKTQCDNHIHRQTNIQISGG